MEINGLQFRPYIESARIQEQVARVASEIARDTEGLTPLFLCVLTGGFMFAADLLRNMDTPDNEIAFVRYASYEGTSSSGTVTRLSSMPEDIKGRHVVIIEDIVDTGLTASKLVNDVKAQGAASVRFASLLYKPANSLNGFKPDYSAFTIDPAFIVGYGLDLDGKGRGLADIYIVESGEWRVESGELRVES